LYPQLEAHLVLGPNVKRLGSKLKKRCNGIYDNAGMKMRLRAGGEGIRHYVYKGGKNGNGDAEQDWKD